jgi:hypothetical protein
LPLFLLREVVGTSLDELHPIRKRDGSWEGLDRRRTRELGAVVKDGLATEERHPKSLESIIIKRNLPLPYWCRDQSLN